MITGILISVATIGFAFYMLFQLNPADNEDDEGDW
jgi:multisubunit Na+/H+ antiporter MnhC subunit